MANDNLHILGICGTFMGGLAVLGREFGFNVSGSDQNVYPPMSTQLEALGIELKQGYTETNLLAAGVPDQVIIGNALSRGNHAVEAVLNQRLDYLSGPEWLAKTVLRKHRVLAVAGTHGKTTTTSMLAWILEHAGLEPGFLVGGVPLNFGVSARLSPRYSRSEHVPPPFVIEADEYDTAFFDKRSKFVHYRPEIAILNNLEFDHADIFPDLAAIEKQFHHLIRTVPSNGFLIVNGDDENLRRVLTMGSYSKVLQFSVKNKNAEFYGQSLSADGSRFAVFQNGRLIGEVAWQLVGAHNVSNALAGVAAAFAFGVEPAKALQALPEFAPPKRRMEFLGQGRGVDLYDDFAHHPTAIRTTLAGLRAKLGTSRTLHAVLEPRSNTMRLGSHVHELAPALADADRVWLLRRPELPWNAESALAPLGDKARILPSTDAIIEGIRNELKAGDAVLFMSNGGFDNIQRNLLKVLQAT